VDGIFISRLVENGLAESTGLLGVNDEVIEVNGIDVRCYCKVSNTPLTSIILRCKANPLTK